MDVFEFMKTNNNYFSDDVASSYLNDEMIDEKTYGIDYIFSCEQDYQRFNSISKPIPKVKQVKQKMDGLAWLKALGIKKIKKPPFDWIDILTSNRPLTYQEGIDSLIYEASVGKLKGNFLKVFRVVLGLRQVDVSEKMGISQARYSQLERGFYPTFELFAKIEKFVYKKAREKGFTLNENSHNQHN